MGITRSLTRGGRVLSARVRGAISLQGFTQDLRDRAANFDLESVEVYAYDLRDVDFSGITTADVRAIEVLSTTGRRQQADRRALVVITNSRIGFGLARMRKLLGSRGFDYEFAIHETMDEADAWIDTYLSRSEPQPVAEPVFAQCAEG